MHPGSVHPHRLLPRQLKTALLLTLVITELFLLHLKVLFLVRSVGDSSMTPETESDTLSAPMEARENGPALFVENLFGKGMSFSICHNSLCLTSEQSAS